MFGVLLCALPSVLDLVKDICASITHHVLFCVTQPSQQFTVRKVATLYVSRGEEIYM